MDRVAAMLILLGVLVSTVLILLALFAVSPIFCSCLVSLLYTLYLFIANEEAGVHHAQEFENRFWTIFAILFSTALFFAKDSPIAFGRWNPTLGFIGVFVSGYGMHAWDRHLHRKELGREVSTLRRGGSAAQSLCRLEAMGIPVEEQLKQIESCLNDIDHLLVPSTINNYINRRFVLQKEREIISIFEEAPPKALNYLISHVKLGLLFYKVKDHRNFQGQHRTELIELLAVDRISVLTVMSRVIVLHALQMMKLPANARAEYWVRNLIVCTNQDDLSELKTRTDAKGDYFCMNKLIYEDIRSETVRQDILTHIRKEAAVQQAHMAMRTKKAKLRSKKAWRKVLSDVDDTLTCSGGSYPAGIDKRYGKKVVYPGVLAFYRELDLGTQGPEEWPENTVGNLVFLSARPHLYKDMSEKHNFAKFAKLMYRGADGRSGMHTVPSLLPGDITSGRDFMVSGDFEPLALKKYENFKRYVSIYPEFKHLFICDNGQGDVRAGELMFDSFPQHLEAVYVHVVQDVSKTHGYAPDRWKAKGLEPCFFNTYPDAALHAATRKSPLIRVSGLRRVCQDAVNDFYLIQTKQWPSEKHKWDQRDELNQALWRCNQQLSSLGEDEVPLIEADRLWRDGQKVRTPYGIATIRGFDPIFDMYQVELDWRPLDVQLAEHTEREKKLKEKQESAPPPLSHGESIVERAPSVLETVLETAEETEDENADSTSSIDNNVGLDEQGSPSGDDRLMSASSISTGSVEGTLSADETSHVVDEIALSPEPVEGSAAASSAEEQTDSKPLQEDTLPNGQRADHTLDDENSGEKKTDPPPADENSETPSPGAPSVPVLATIQGRYITKYTPPTLPVLPKEDKGRSIFSFWGTTSGEKKDTKHFKAGDKCTTPFGPATVVEHRREEGIVVVDMIGWKARSYLQQDVVKIMSKGLLRTLLGRIGSGEVGDSSPQKRVVPPKELEFPYAVGTIIHTPFGEGVVSRPLPAPKEKKPPSAPPKKEKKPPSAPPKKEITKLDGTTTKDPKADKQTTTTTGTSSGDAADATKSAPTSVSTIGISLTSWVLANETHPVLYCTPDTAREWKRMKEEGKTRTGLLTAIGRLFQRKSSSVVPPAEKKPPTQPEQDVTTSPRFERYYQDSAAVTTSFGDGVVKSFRETDGFYEVSLVKWKMANGVCPIAYLRKDDLSYRIAKGCHEGYPVLTSLGLSGTLASVEPTTGVHMVTIPSAGMVCYLQPEHVLRPLKAAVGEDVVTPYGEGRVRKYRVDDDMYEIELNGGWGGATLYAQGETFDRVHDGMKDGKGLFGMNWLLRFFFSSEEKKGGDGGSSRSRSRSNSIVSLSVRSQSGRSLT